MPTIYKYRKGRFYVNTLKGSELHGTGLLSMSSHLLEGLFPCLIHQLYFYYYVYLVQFILLDARAWKSQQVHPELRSAPETVGKLVRS